MEVAELIQLVVVKHILLVVDRKLVAIGVVLGKHMVSMHILEAIARIQLGIAGNFEVED